MRIISGKYKGRLINSPKGLPVRPTTDRTKEALFNILTHTYEIQDKQVLDLFAGTGGVSLEFLSRGAASVTCVDIHPKCIQAIEALARAFGVSSQTKIIRQDVTRYVSETSYRYDIIFMDPPYEMNHIEGIIQTVRMRNLLAENGVLIVEHSSLKSFEREEGFDEVRQYGSSSVSFFVFP